MALRSELKGQQSSVRFWKDKTPQKSFSSPDPAESDDMEIDELIGDFKSVSLQEVSRATLIDTNSNFNELCDQLSSLQVSQYRENTLKEADLIARRVDHDLKLINELYGKAKDAAETEQRFMIVQIFQTYKRCLELDIEKWKCKLQSQKKSPSEIASVKIIIRDFIPWEQRLHSAPVFREEKLQKPEGNTIVDQIGFVQLALNYWRSCYRNMRHYEKLLKMKPYDAEKELWKLEQTTISYYSATTKGAPLDDLNHIRLREPKNINPTTGEPLSIATIKELIEQQQERSGYKPGL